MDPFDVLREKLRTRMNDLADTMSTGGCRTFEDYRKMCGVIEGLAYAERDLLDLKETMEKNDE